MSPGLQKNPTLPQSSPLPLPPPLQLPRLSRRDVDAELTRLSLNAERWGMQPARLESVYRRTVTIPDHEPVFTDVFAASGGYVWLRGFSTSEEVTWTRHSLRGDPVVQVALSRRDVIKDAAHDWLWIVRRGEFDVPRLVKLKVGGEAASSPAPPGVSREIVGREDGNSRGETHTKNGRTGVRS